MSGRILIVDDLATNRIVLKVKLVSAHYEVIQAGSAQEALALAVESPPDLILANTRLSTVTAAEFVTALRRQACLATIPVMFLQPFDHPEERLNALCAGADEVLVKPVQESLLLARLRNLLRQHHVLQELIGQGETSQPMGLAEPHTDFDRPGHVTIAASSRSEALGLQTRLMRSAAHRVTATDMAHVLPLSGSDAPADIYLLRIAETEAEDGLRLLADLKAAQRIRTSPVMALLDAGATALAVTLLDMGADDVLIGLPDQAELCLRLTRQMQRKHRAERLRAALRDGLQAAVFDPLTGAHNRRYALPFVTHLIETGLTNGESFAVMIADLDFFKQVNDDHGHAAGDHVLCEVTRLLRAHLRNRDMLARIGGEEFLIVTPATGRLEAQDTADRLCAMIRRTPIVLPGHKGALHVTVSIGVTMALSAPGLPPPCVGQLLEEADRALYSAKAQGRDTVTFCGRSAA